MTESVQTVRKSFTQRPWPGILAGGLWLCVLLSLTILTANPVTLNRQQIKISDFIVRGQFDPQSQEFLIQESWPELAEMQSVKLVNLDQIPVNSADEYLVPVVMIDKQFHVTPSLVKGLPLIYPSAPEALVQLKHILNEKPLQ